MENIQKDLQQDYISKKQERDRKLKSEQVRKNIKKSIKWLFGFAIMGLVVFGFYKLATKPTIPAPGESFTSLGQEHIQPGSSHPAYNSNPPTSGWHYPQPAQSGIYDTQFPDEQLIHNLEHGQIWIAYKPDLAKDQVELLADIAKSYGSKMIMEPRKENDSPIAIVAWLHLFKLNVVDEVKIKAFIDAYRGHGPESVPDYGFKDFRSKK